MVVGWDGPHPSYTNTAALFWFAIWFPLCGRGLSHQNFNQWMVAMYKQERWVHVWAVIIEASEPWGPHYKFMINFNKLWTISIAADYRAEPISLAHAANGVCMLGLAQRSGPPNFVIKSTVGLFRLLHSHFKLHFHFFNYLRNYQE